MKTIYIVKLNKKYLSKIIRLHIYFEEKKEKQDNCYLYIDLENYDKLKKYKHIYPYELIGYKGIKKYQLLIKKYALFFILTLIGIGFLFTLSNMIFKIEIKTNDLEIKELLESNLEKYDIKLFHFMKSFSKKEEIKNKILKENKDRLEWLEITRIGCKYIINVEERILNNIDDNKTPQDIVALKNAIILSIDARSGSIVKKLNDYVKKGEVIVTGKLTHNEEVVDLVRSEAVIYGETWYNIHISYPLAYYEKTYTGNKNIRYKFTFLNNTFNLLGNSYQEEDVLENKIFYHPFLPIKFSKEEVKEVVLIDDVYTVEEATSLAISKAREKLLSTLAEDSKILSEKKLKIIVNNSTIDVDVFFKVYENITDFKEIIVEEGE